MCSRPNHHHRLPRHLKLPLNRNPIFPSPLLQLFSPPQRNQPLLKRHLPSLNPLHHHRASRQPSLHPKSRMSHLLNLLKRPLLLKNLKWKCRYPHRNLLLKPHRQQK